MRISDWTRFSALCLTTIFAASYAWAAAPKLDFTLPSGATRGSTTTVTLTGTFDPWPVSVWTNRPELEIKPAEEKGKLQVTVPADCPPGLAWLRIYNPEGAATVRPFYIGALPELEETEPNEKRGEPQVIAELPVVISGRYQARNDIDIFQVELAAGQTLIADLSSVQSLGSPADASLQIATADGFVLAQNDDDQGYDPRLVFMAPAAGKYLIRTFAFPVATDSSISFAGGANWVYRLTLTTGGFAEVAEPLVVQRQTAADVLFSGWNLGEAPLGMPVPAVDADDTWLLPGVGGPAVRLRTSPYPAQREPDHPADQPVVLTALPVGVTGRISTANEADVYQVPGVKGQALRVRVDAREWGSLMDPVLEVRTPEGNVLQKQDDQGQNRDAEVNVTPQADGPLLVRVTDLYRQGSGRHWYHLTIRTPAPELQLTLAAGEFLLESDKPLDIPVTIARVDGYSEEVEIALTGLPEGVECPPVISAAQGDSSKQVTLKLTGGTAAFSGPIRVVARKAGQPDLLAMAKVTVTPADVGTLRDAWLTVVKK